jgi:hypothetical protein
MWCYIWELTVHLSRKIKMESKGNSILKLSMFSSSCGDVMEKPTVIKPYANAIGMITEEKVPCYHVLKSNKLNLSVGVMKEEHY